jgi:uncharacterized protein YecE (DUF72 family)
MEFGAGTFEFKEDSYPFEKAHINSKLCGAKRIHLGLPQWGEPRWKGTFYSQKCRPADFLSEYVHNLSCVEVSSTFYSQIPEPSLVQWAEIAPQGFHYLPKWPKQLTHQQGLRNPQEIIKSFSKQVEKLGESLGTTILQLPPNFTTQARCELFNFFCQRPAELPLTIEFRHSSWFEDRRLYNKIEDYLMENNIGMVISDTPARRDLSHLSFTGDKMIIRYLSDENLYHDQKRLELWRNWLSETEIGADIYFTLHRPDNDITPDLISYFDQALYNKIQDKLKDPQEDLFN